MPTAFATSAPLLVPIQTAALQLGISRSSVYRLIDAGSLETRFLGSRHLIVGESLRRFVDGLPRGEAV